ncbi:hypothetical protein Tco_0313241 [Tanacetum coccineum]
MNIITRNAYNTIMVEGLESTGKNLVAVVRDVYVFVGSFTYITNVVVLEDIGKFIQINNRIFDNYTFQIPRTILKFKHLGLFHGVRFHPSSCPEYQVDESMKEWLIHGHVSIHEVTLYLMRRSLEVLRKFNLTTLGGRFNHTWMAFGENTRDLGSFGEETDNTTDLHQISRRIIHTERGDGIAIIKRRRRDLSSDGVSDLTTASGRG